VIDSVTFSIPTTASVSGSATGTVQPLKFAPALFPSDGDNATAASVNTPISGDYDRTAFLGTATGAWKNAKMQPIGSTSWQIDGSASPAGTGLAQVTIASGGT
jgi:hypothetical protein